MPSTHGPLGIESQLWSAAVVEEHGGARTEISVPGQEADYITWERSKMNLAIRSIEADIRGDCQVSFLHDESLDLPAGFISVNPACHGTEWAGQLLVATCPGSTAPSSEPV